MQNGKIVLHGTFKMNSTCFFPADTAMACGRFLWPLGWRGQAGVHP
jgi:hypothetical protein